MIRLFEDVDEIHVVRVCQVYMYESRTDTTLTDFCYILSHLAFPQAHSTSSPALASGTLTSGGILAISLMPRFSIDVMSSATGKDPALHICRGFMNAHISRLTKGLNDLKSQGMSHAPKRQREVHRVRECQRAEQGA